MARWLSLLCMPRVAVALLPALPLCLAAKLYLMPVRHKSGLRSSSKHAHKLLSSDRSYFHTGLAA